MGAAESVVRNVDKRTARRENRTEFVGAIDEFRQVLEIQQAETLLDKQSSNRSINTDDNRFIRVCIRKRPIFEHEVSAGEFDVITCQRQEQSGDGVGRIIVHDARMHADMRRMMMDHHTFEYDEVFGEDVDNQGIYLHTTSRLIDSVVHGGDATVMMYGQTGSGKTYTMSSIYEQAARELFTKIEDSKETITVKLTFLELAGDSCSDILNESKPVKLVTTADGAVEAYPSVEVPVSSADEMMSFIRHATTMRVKAATGVHDSSSRSHAICRVYLHRSTNGSQIVHPGVNSMLTLVDLAGSEHRIDSAEHDANRRKEGAQINSSLMKLKECVRARANQSSYIPYRQSKLTHLLRASFVEPPPGGVPSQTVIIATVSPSSKDTEHSLNTLRHACIMDGQGESDEKRWVSGGERIRVFVGEIDVAGIARARKRDKRGNGGETSKSDSSKPGSGSRQRNGNSSGNSEGGGGGAKWQALSKNHARDGSIDSISKAMNEKKAAVMKEKRRKSEERRSLAEMSSIEVDALMKARQQAGSAQRQRIGERERRGSNPDVHQQHKHGSVTAISNAQAAQIALKKSTSTQNVSPRTSSASRKLRESTRHSHTNSEPKLSRPGSGNRSMLGKDSRPTHTQGNVTTCEQQQLMRADAVTYEASNSTADSVTGIQTSQFGVPQPNPSSLPLVHTATNGSAQPRRSNSRSTKSPRSTTPRRHHSKTNQATNLAQQDQNFHNSQRYQGQQQRPDVPNHVMVQRLQLVKNGSDTSKARHSGVKSSRGSVHLPDPNPRKPSMEELKNRVWRDPMVPRSMREREFIAVLRDHGYLDNDDENDDNEQANYFETETPEVNKSARSTKSFKSVKSSHSIRSNKSSRGSTRSRNNMSQEHGFDEERPIRSKYRPNSRGTVVDAEAEMERLKQELQTAESQQASKATLFGIRKRLAVQKAILIRDERRKLALQQQMEEDGGRHLIL